MTDDRSEAAPERDNAAGVAYAVCLGAPREPYWLSLGRGLRVRVRPCTTALAAQARAAARRRLRAALEAAGEDGEEGVDPDARAGEAEALYAEELAALAVEAWEGVGNADGTADAPCTPANVRALMRDVAWAADQFQVLYESGLAERAAEKNASGPSPSGTSAAGPSTAPGAARTAHPAPQASARAAAPTTSTRRTPKPATRPGT